MAKELHHPILAGVVGWPVGHSLSPLIHGTWAKRAGINGHYVPLAVPPSHEEFARAMDALRTLGFAGVNVTLPHKEHALRYADRASKAANRAGAANMLSFGAEGAVADNSDIAGFAAAVREVSSAPGSSALILGAGGAARGVALALHILGFKSIDIANRTRDKAGALAKTFGLGVVGWSERSEALAGVDLVVNTTSLGMTGEPPLDVDLSLLRQSAIVADIVYAPLETPLLAAAAERGNKTVDGLSMLMHQAVPGFNAWFGGEAAVDGDLRRKLAGELARRASS